MTLNPCKVHGVPPIEESYDKSVEKKSMTERYYTPLYRINFEGENEDFCVLFHSNRICVITLAPSHCILKSQKKVEKIDCQVSSNVNRLTNKASGKSKRGAQELTPSSVLFFVQCTDGSRFAVRSCVPGKLVEINDQLFDNPNLLVERPSDQGYLAIILPTILSSAKYKEELLAAEDYQSEIMKRVGGGD